MALLSVFMPQAFCQTAEPTPNIPDGGTREALVSIYIPTIADAPFTASLNTEWVRVLADGSRITLKNHRLIARDSRGRIFQERRLLVPDNGKQESVLTQTEIHDPISEEEFICVPRELVCQVEVFHPATASPRKKPGPQETLGTRWIQGVETVGTKDSAVTPAGAIGNDSPIVSKSEYWYSKQLGFNLLSIRDDPRFGSQRFEVSDLVVGEPDAKLFVVPEGSQVIDLRRAVAN